MANTTWSKFDAPVTTGPAEAEDLSTGGRDGRQGNRAPQCVEPPSELADTATVAGRGDQRSGDHSTSSLGGSRMSP
jgi:hypothetical protein